MGSQCSKLFERCITDKLSDFQVGIKGPLTYAGFLITHIENASVFLLTSYITGALTLCCICAFSVGLFHLEQRAP